MNSISNLTRGASYPAVTKSDVEQVGIPVPSIETQRRIVAVLEQIQEIRRRRIEANQFTSKVIQSVFLKMFGDPEANERGWATRPLGDMTKISRRIVKPKEEHQDLLHVGGENIESVTGRLINLRTIKEDGIRSVNFLISPRDILYCKIRPNLRKVAMPDFEGLCSADIYPLTPAQGVTREFLCHLLRSDVFTKYASAVSTSRANIPKINRTELENYVTICPPLSEQHRFSQIAQLASHLTEIQEASLEEINELFQSLMQKAFRGELRELTET